MENSEECHRAGCGGGGGAGGRQLQQQRRYCHQGNQLKKLENRPPGMDDDGANEQNRAQFKDGRSDRLKNGP